MPSAGPPFKVSFTITVDDVVAYVRLLQRRLNATGVVLGLVVMGIGSTIATVTQDAFTGIWTLLIGLLLVVLAGTEYLDRWRVNRGARSLIGSTASFTFDDKGIDAETVAGHGDVQWSAITELKRNDRVLVIKGTRSPVVWIPTRAFPSPDEALALSSYIEERISATRAG